MGDAPKRFGYYRRLSRAQKRIYDESDEWGAIELEDPGALAPLAGAIGEALAADDRVGTERASRELVRGICDQLNVPSPSARVLAVRPRSASAELHGLYVREPDARPVLMVWMRTAQNERPVAHRTFVRTLAHEVGHHLDYELLELEDSFHTHGFFQRESSLVRQLLGRGRPKVQTPVAPPTELVREPTDPQLVLPW
ncbi:MAG: hypothetical protein AB7S26_41565 [Sandaracinaceae bacterium]